MRRRRSPNQVSVRAFYEPRRAPAHSRDTTLQPDRPARGGWLGELRAKGGLSTSLGRRVVLVVVRFSALDVGCLVSTSVAWIVVLLVSSKQVAGTWLPSKY